MRDINFERSYNALIRTPIVGNAQSAAVKPSVNKPSVDFSEILRQKISDNSLIISKHANQRITDRNINVTETVIERLNAAVDKAREKGIRDALIFGNDMAFIVNIPNNTVITAMNSKDMQENIFTNIDGAVML
ncbi:MAG TPA: hypothetical protein GXX17_07565 [Clostridiales bacterium]|nr:hypothetical protein [Clostridiales bacterium]